jgi:hypothetical protein
MLVRCHARVTNVSWGLSMQHLIQMNSVATLSFIPGAHVIVYTHDGGTRRQVEALNLGIEVRQHERLACGSRVRRRDSPLTTPRRTAQVSSAFASNEFGTPYVASLFEQSIQNHVAKFYGCVSTCVPVPVTCTAANRVCVLRQLRERRHPAAARPAAHPRCCGERNP